MLTGPPTVLCVTGPPGAGKSELARTVSQRLQLPLFDRDDFKDILFGTLGWSDREWSQRVGVASWALLDAVASTLIAQRVSMVLDTNFRPSDAVVVHLAALAEAHGVARLEVHLRADTGVLYRRYRSRFLEGRRHPGHVAFETESDFSEQVNDDAFPAVGFGAVLDLDTTHAWPDSDAVVVWVARQLGQTPA